MAGPGSELSCYPWSPATWLLVVWGLATAGMSWFFPGAHPLSQVLHAIAGVALLGFALWGVWRPRVVVADGVLIEHAARAAPLPLREIAGVVAVPRTGHRPSELDLERLLGLKLRSGDFRWVDLRWLRAADRDRLRELARAVALCP